MRLQSLSVAFLQPFCNPSCYLLHEGCFRCRCIELLAGGERFDTLMQGL